MKMEPIDVGFAVVRRRRRWKIDADTAEHVLRLIGGTALLGWAFYCSTLIR